MTILRGLGDCGVATTDLSGGPSAQVLYPYPAFEFEFGQEVESEDAEAYRGGKLTTEETLETKVTSTLKLITKIANWQLFGLGFGQLQRTLTSLVMPKLKRTTVPSGGVVSDAALVSGNIGSVIVAIERYGSWGQAGPFARASSAPTAGQVQVATGSMTFHTSAVGAPIMYLYDETIASVKAYGGAGTLASYGELQFVGEVYDNTANPEQGGRIWFPRCSRKTRPTLGYAGEAPQLEIELSVLNPTGWPEPFLMIDGHSITA
jgi:hypothetical protein